ncbi:MAG: hypothetical protein R3B13_26825 [Polyangiaceae bacterium]
MPSLLHEGLLALIRERPEFAADLLREVLRVEVPEFTEARIAEATLTELIPAEYRADLVVLLVNDKPVFGVVHEAQLEPKPRKRFTWPVYATALRARFECDVAVVVVTVDDATARWASEPILLGGQSVYVPYVIGPRGVPLVTDEEHAKRDPELAVLSVMAHGRGEESVAVAAARAAIAGIAGIDEDRWVLYSSLIESSLSDAARKAFEMLPKAHQFFSESQRKSFDRGRVQSQARAIIRVLSRRNLAVFAEQRERIESCTDLETLDRWLDRAVTAASTEDIFAE